MKSRANVLLSACLAVGVVLVSGGAGPTTEYEFVPDTIRVVKVALHQWQGSPLDIGRLDGAGNLVPVSYDDCLRLFRFAPLPKNASDEQPIIELVNIPVINEPADGADVEAVYEFRSGLLVKGLLKKYGGFVPELGSRVISFDDYHYGPTAPRIYNLPGRFAPKPAAPPKN